MRLALLMAKPERVRELDINSFKAEQWPTWFGFHGTGAPRSASSVQESLTQLVHMRRFDGGDPVDTHLVFFVWHPEDLSVSKLLVPPHSEGGVKSAVVDKAKENTRTRFCSYCGSHHTNPNAYISHLLGDHYRAVIFCGRCTSKPRKESRTVNKKQKKGDRFIPAWRGSEQMREHFRTFHRGIGPQDDLPAFLGGQP